MSEVLGVGGMGSRNALNAEKAFGKEKSKSVTEKKIELHQKTMRRDILGIYGID